MDGSGSVESDEELVNEDEVKVSFLGLRPNFNQPPLFRRRIKIKKRNKTMKQKK